MKFTILKDHLTNALNDVLKAVNTKTTMPILTGVKIEVTNEGVNLTGSDSDVTIQTFIPTEIDATEIVEIEQTGAVVLQARMLNEIVRKLPTNKVEIELADGVQTYIRSGKSVFHLIATDATEYPLLPELSQDNQFTVPANILKAIIRKTVFAVALTESRPVLTGVSWQIEGNDLTCIATDSHRLARYKTKLEQEMGSYNVVIPGKSLNELSKILDDAAEPVQIVITQQQVLFKAKNMLFFSRLLEGNYPDTSRLIPSDFQTNITLNGRELFQAIDRASLLARTNSNNVVRLTTINNGAVEISSNSPEIGQVQEEISLQSLDGEALKISFSAKYMMEALKAIDDDEMLIQFTGAMRPFILRPAADDTNLQLILPVRTS
ncbi:DNA polymerase III subunit beta [Lysinibacillus sp. BF-4]|uniref:DNA polymerase III subunit beta n=1 Tax=Lysinibacillus sp. BF-4 TaxID=1473546 RepID=UPI000504A175|nr:DNA polymerase III subunit beta [Lysinibacillus sp. BF-4]KFL43684.1 DNA polymerase III subunit beta [Lysinibacillus sp. BF-4]